MAYTKFGLSSLIIVALLACNNEASTEAKDKSEKKDSITQVVAQSASAAENEKESAIVQFKVNGVDARTEKGDGNDNEMQLGMMNVQNMQLGLDLLGDDPSHPHRGWIHFTIDNFKLEPAKYTTSDGNSILFTRYETANAGGGKDYIATNQKIDKGSSMNIELTNVTKNERAEAGEEWLLSGTFSAKLLIREFSMAKRGSNESLEISEGKFENVPLKVLGRK